MSRRYGNTISVEVEADVYIAEVLAEASIEELNAALRDKENAQGTDQQEALYRIWVEVMHHGRDLGDIVDELMRERAWTWRRPYEATAAGGTR